MTQFIVSQMHIEAARNSTDDFNLFHDKFRWHHIAQNPFQGPIALGFQLGCFVEDQTNSFNKSTGGQSSEYNSVNQSLDFSCYELNFAGVVKPQDELSAVVRKGRLSDVDGINTFSNRIAIKANDKTVLLGYKRLSAEHLINGIEDLPAVSDIIKSEDRCFISPNNTFLKRKYMIVGNAKSFLTSSFAEQSEYIDEFVDKVSFPEMYPLSLLSSALLERAQAIGHDLVKEPMIYLSHRLSINRSVLKTLKSNHGINILVSPEQSLGGGQIEEGETVIHHCTCITQSGDILFHAEIQLAPLSFLLDSNQS